MCGELEALDLLLAAGAQLALPDSHGALPVHYAVQMCVASGVERKEVKMNIGFHFGLTWLFYTHSLLADIGLLCRRCAKRGCSGCWPPPVWT